METAIANQIAARFPDLHVTEDVMSNESYWVNVRVGNRWLVIQKSGNHQIGISVIQDESLDFSGHDHVFAEVSEAMEFAFKKIGDLSRGGGKGDRSI